MSMLSRTQRSSIVGGLLAVVLALAPVASAEQQPDGRAFERGRNTVSCDDLGGGALLDPGDLSAARLEPGQRYLTIRDVSAGITITGIVVSSGDSYNVYIPGKRGVAKHAPWEGLRAPRNKAGEAPVISDWFACGKSTPAPTRAAPAGAATTVSTLSTAPSGATSAQHADVRTRPTRTTPSTRSPHSVRAQASDPSGTPGASDSDSPSATKKRSADKDTVVASAELAYTGFGDRWLVPFGLALVLAGTAVLLLVRSPRRRE